MTTDWTREEVEAAQYAGDEHYPVDAPMIRTSAVRAIMDKTFGLLAARAGKMTAERLGELFSMPWVVNCVPAEEVQAHIAALSAEVATLSHRVVALESRIREYHSDTGEADLNHNEAHDGIDGIVGWVKAYKAKLGNEGIFDSGLRCVSEGGEVFYLDPEEIEAVCDDRDTLRAKLTQLQSSRELHEK